MYTFSSFNGNAGEAQRQLTSNLANVFPEFTVLYEIVTENKAESFLFNLELHSNYWISHIIYEFNWSGNHVQTVDCMHYTTLTDNSGVICILFVEINALWDNIVFSTTSSLPPRSLETIRGNSRCSSRALTYIPAAAAAEHTRTSQPLQLQSTHVHPSRCSSRAHTYTTAAAALEHTRTPQPLQLQSTHVHPSRCSSRAHTRTSQPL